MNEGTCSVCKDRIKLLKNGRIGRHSSRTGKGQWPPRMCDGWNREPARA